MIQAGTARAAALDLFAGRFDSDLPAPMSPKQLRLQPWPYGTAARYVEAHHYLGYAPPGHKLSLAVMFGGRVLGVLMLGHPVARHEDQCTTLELLRMHLDDACPRNSESRVLGVMARIVAQRCPKVQRLIAYSDTSRHSGTIYRAAGWRMVGISPGGEWTSAARASRHSGWATAPKAKWERLLPLDGVAAAGEAQARNGGGERG